MDDWSSLYLIHYSCVPHTFWCLSMRILLNLHRIKCHHGWIIFACKFKHLVWKVVPVSLLPFSQGSIKPILAEPNTNYILYFSSRIKQVHFSHKKRKTCCKVDACLHYSGVCNCFPWFLRSLFPCLELKVIISRACINYSLAPIELNQFNKVRTCRSFCS